MHSAALCGNCDEADPTKREELVEVDDSEVDFEPFFEALLSYVFPSVGSGTYPWLTNEPSLRGLHSCLESPRPDLARVLSVDRLAHKHGAEVLARRARTVTLKLTHPDRLTNCLTDELTSLRVVEIAHTLDCITALQSGWSIAMDEFRNRKRGPAEIIALAETTGRAELVGEAYYEAMIQEWHLRDHRETGLSIEQQMHLLVGVARCSAKADEYLSDWLGEIADLEESSLSELLYNTFSAAFLRESVANRVPVFDLLGRLKLVGGLVFGSNLSALERETVRRIQQSAAEALVKEGSIISENFASYIEASGPIAPVITASLSDLSDSPFVVSIPTDLEEVQYTVNLDEGDPTQRLESANGSEIDSYVIDDGAGQFEAPDAVPQSIDTAAAAEGTPPFPLEQPAAISPTTTRLLPLPLLRLPSSPLSQKGSLDPPLPSPLIRADLLPDIPPSVLSKIEKEAEEAAEAIRSAEEEILRSQEAEVALAQAQAEEPDRVEIEAATGRVQEEAEAKAAREKDEADLARLLVTRDLTVLQQQKLKRLRRRLGDEIVAIVEASVMARMQGYERPEV